ncbi:MAG: DUF4129 domain-containing protein [Tahibacter sp.]
MQLDGVTVALRARAPWEATDLGIALVRTHARPIFGAWVVVTLPIFLLLNGLCYLLGPVWLAWILMWWLKPIFDRIPLFILSRAVFGAPPSLRESLSAQWNWGWRGIWPWLLWRRLHIGRAMLLPVDLLEGLTGATRSARVAVLARASGSPNAMLTIICVHLEGMLAVSIIALGLMFVPVEFLTESARAAWETLFEDPPAWALLLTNFNTWIAMSIVEPFYVGAGFGLYLNRRTQLEGWDIELAFRRLASRLSQAMMVALVAISLAAVSITAARATESSSTRAETADATGAGVVPSPAKLPPVVDKLPLEDSKKPGGGDREDVATLQAIFADGYRDDSADFETAVKKAYADPDLSPKVTEFAWKRRHPRLDEPSRSAGLPGWAQALAGAISFIVGYGLWIIAVILLIFVAMSHRRWLPWISDRIVRERALDRVESREIHVPEVLPVDIPAEVRRLWAQESPRAALALLYRASVRRLADAQGTPLPPGATESQCLRHARDLPDRAYANLFARVVRCWQAVAYAQTLPRVEDVETLLGEWTAVAEEPA